MSNGNGSTTKWAIGMIFVILIGAVGWVFGFSRPTSTKVDMVEGRTTSLERRVDINDTRYLMILERLNRIDDKIDKLK